MEGLKLFLFLFVCTERLKNVGIENTTVFLDWFGGFPTTKDLCVWGTPTQLNVFFFLFVVLNLNNCVNN